MAANADADFGRSKYMEVLMKDPMTGRDVFLEESGGLEPQAAEAAPGD